MEEQAKGAFLIKTAYFLTVWVGTALICRFLLWYLTPFLVGGLMAWTVQKPACFLAGKSGIKRSVFAVGLVIILFCAGGAVMVFGMIKGVEALAEPAQILSRKVPELFADRENLYERMKPFFARLPAGFAEAARGWAETAGAKIAETATDFFASFAAKVVGRVPSFLFGSIVTLVSGCYIAADFERLIAFVQGVIGAKRTETVRKIKRIITQSVGKLIKGTCLISALVFLMLTAGFFLLRVPHAVFTAAGVALVDLLPILGTGTVLLPWGIGALLIGNPATGIGLLVLYAAITVARNFIEPRVMGKQTGINPLFTLLAMFIGLKLFGGFGVLLLPVVLMVTVEYYKDEMRKERTPDPGQAS